jgi:dolichyl-phosphate beta-glucosyltransferase
MKAPIYLSVIVPVHNEATRLENCLEQLLPVAREYLYEIILVENGSTDDTPARCDLASRVYPGVRYIRLHDRGKGLAVRAGMLAATGRYRYMCDVDLSTPAREIHRFIQKARVDDVVIGSREKDRSTVHTSAGRYMIGRLIHQVVAGLLPGIDDTQCGFKMFRDYAAMDIFEQCHIDSVAFDVEALYLARLLNYRVHEIPVTWQADGESRMGFNDGVDFLLDVFSLYGRSVARSVPQS